MKGGSARLGPPVASRDGRGSWMRCSSGFVPQLILRRAVVFLQALRRLVLIVAERDLPDGRAAFHLR